MPNTPTRARGPGRVPATVGESGPSTTVTDVLLEVELVDVRLVEARRRPEDDLAVGADRPGAEVSGLERLALLARDLPGGQRGGRVAGEVADVLGDPQRELVDRAVLDELAHLVGRAEAGQLDLALLRRGREVARRRRDADGGRRDDALEVRIGLQEALRLLEGLLVVVVAIGDLHELDVLVLRLGQLLLHVLDPGVLVRGVGRGREDRDLALAADLLGDEVDLALADERRRRLVDEHRPGAGRDVGVHRHDLDAALGRLLERRRHRVGVVARDDQRVGLLLDGRVDDRDLRGRAGVRRARDAVRAADLLERLLDAGVLGLLVGVAELLGDRDDLQALLDLGVGIRLAGALRTRARARAGGRRGAVVLRGAAGGDEECRGQGERDKQRTRGARTDGLHA